MATKGDGAVSANRLHQEEAEALYDGDDDAAHDGLPVELAEGSAYEYGGLPFAVPRAIVARGELWARPVNVRLTSTHDDVLSVSIDGGGDASCLREAIWSWPLPDDFTEEQRSYTIRLPAGDKASSAAGSRGT